MSGPDVLALLVGLVTLTICAVLYIGRGVRKFRATGPVEMEPADDVVLVGRILWHPSGLFVQYQAYPNPVAEAERILAEESA